MLLRSGGVNSPGRTVTRRPDDHEELEPARAPEEEEVLRMVAPLSESLIKDFGDEPSVDLQRLHGDLCFYPSRGLRLPQPCFCW